MQTNDMKIKAVIASLVLIVTVCFSACSSRPDYVLSNGDMEDVLYDIHKAHYLPEQMNESRSNGALQYALMLNVLKQHDVTQAEWDSSMVYYTRHADEMQDIYSNLMERLEYEASAMGASVAEGADSTDIWNADRHLLLIPNDLSSTYQWTLNCDTLLQKGEKATLRFQGLYLNDNAQRRATAVLVMRLSNDSVIVRQQMITQSAIYKLELSDDDAIGIKSLSGLFVISSSSLGMSGGYGDDSSKRNTSSQILSLTDIVLLHEPKEKPSNAAPATPETPDAADADSTQRIRAIHSAGTPPGLSRSLKMDVQ